MSKEIRPLFAAAALSFTINLLPLMPAIASDTVCPDYAEFRGLLREGERVLGDYQLQYTSGRKKGDSYPEIGMNPQGLTALQHAIVCAEFEEQQGNLAEALKWWNGVLTMLPQSSSFVAQDQDNVARINSRLGDIYLALSRPDISEASIRDFDSKKETWMFSRLRLRSLTPSSTTVLPVNELTNARVQKILELLSQESSHTPISPGARKNLQLALMHYQKALDERKNRKAAVSYCVLDSIKSATIQHCLGKFDDERNSMRSALAAFLDSDFHWTFPEAKAGEPCTSMDHVADSDPIFAKTTQSRVRGMDLQSAHNISSQQRTIPAEVQVHVSKGSSTKLAKIKRKSEVKPPTPVGVLPPVDWGKSVHTCCGPTPEWAYEEGSFIGSTTMAVLFTSRLLTCALTNGVDIATNAATRAEPISVLDRAVKFPLAHGNKPNVQLIEKKLAQLFGEKLWVPSAMVTYVKFNRPQDVKRLYHAKSNEYLIYHSRADERMKVGEALAQIGASTELEQYFMLWKSSLPVDPVARAYSQIALAKLKHSAVSEAASDCDAAILELQKDKLNDEESVNTKIEIANMVISMLSKSSPSSISRKAIANARKLVGMCNHRLMQLDCLTLAKQLHMTGARLERAGQFAPAAKVYNAAAEIYLKNLGEKDIETGNYLVDSARTLMLSGDLARAESRIELALRVIRASPKADNDSLRTGLQTYADILNTVGNAEKVEPIYDELRRLP
ncbi:MAG: hypothetical protein K2X93_27200 [Candidatus Obscuribacterales bacterium]|nr:hypothetical protein [Candidatus Obscuribacterales bacterium]